MPDTTHRSPRLYVELPLDGTSLALDESEAHYLGHVLRLEPGRRLVVFDGRGTERDASVESLQRRGAVLKRGAVRAPLPESPLDLTLLQALPKSDAMDMIVQKATELGARALLPVCTEFSVVKLDGERSERRVDHWRKIARSACEQCGRHAPPRIEPPRPLNDALATLAAAPKRLALEPSAERSLGEQPPPDSGLVLAIGPEGGF